VASGSLCQVVGRDRPLVAHGSVQTELVTQPHAQAQHRSGHLADDLAHERLELGFVDRVRRRAPPCSVGDRSATARASMMRLHRVPVNEA
jgi:hypothetical protein